MIKIENVVTASPAQMNFIVEGMRNPMNSWDKADSIYMGDDGYFLGESDCNLMMRLSNAGPEHRKFMRMMPVYARITAPLYFWKEFDTYKVGTVSNSCSTMHKIHAKKFTREDFSTEHLSHDNLVSLDEFIEIMNFDREQYVSFKNKDDWWQMIQMLPSSYNQTRNIMMNYETLHNIYHQRKYHKLDEWRKFCKWIEEELPYSKLIIKENTNDN